MGRGQVFRTFHWLCKHFAYIPKERKTDHRKTNASEVKSWCTWNKKQYQIQINVEQQKRGENVEYITYLHICVWCNIWVTEPAPHQKCHFIQRFWCNQLTSAVQLTGSTKNRNYVNIQGYIHYIFNTLFLGRMIHYPVGEAEA